MNEEQKKRILAGDYASLGRDIKEKAARADQLAAAIFETLVPNLYMAMNAGEGPAVAARWEDCPLSIKLAYQMTAVQLLVIEGVKLE